jgi:phospholipid/cholesterol/gamma-HCH transport system substrate-binding protein
MAKERAKTETLVGTFILAGLVMLGGLILQFGNIAEWVKGKYEMTVDFSQAVGIGKGSTVRMLGAKIGEVSKKPELMENLKLRVPLAIEEKFQIPTGSVFQISQANLLGDKEIVVTPPEGQMRGFIAPGAELVGGGASGLEQIQEDAEMITADARILMKDARTAMIKMDSALDDIRAVAVRLSESIEIVNDEVLSEKNLLNLSKGIANFQKATETVNTLGGDLGPAIADARLAIKDIRAAFAEIKATAGNANLAIDKVAPALDRVPQTLATIEKTVDQAGSAIAKLEKGDGAIAALISDQETKEDTQVFIKNLRKHGILRYQDEETTEESDPRDRFRGRRR